MNASLLREFALNYHFRSMMTGSMHQLGGVQNNLFRNLGGLGGFCGCRKKTFKRVPRVSYLCLRYRYAGSECFILMPSPECRCFYPSFLLTSSVFQILIHGQGELIQAGTGSFSAHHLSENRRKICVVGKLCSVKTLQARTSSAS